MIFVGPPQATKKLDISRVIIPGNTEFNDKLSPFSPSPAGGSCLPACLPASRRPGSIKKHYDVNLWGNHTIATNFI